MDIKAMIISVGGTIQPIVKSISEYSPEFVSFFASQDTVSKLIEIESELKNNSVNIKREITLIDDVNDLYHCYNKSIEAVKRVLSKGYNKDEVIVDYTGGTKNMSVALALASINFGFSYSYVGGIERTKEGVGIVIDGQEKIYQSINPWDFLAIDDKKRISNFFNTYHFKAARDICNELSEKTGKIKFLFRKIAFLIDFYYNWDLFNYTQALQILNRKEIYELEECEDAGIRDFAKKTFLFKDFIEKLSKNSNKPTLNLILDLFANAERRFEQGKIDDAVLRLYRIVEMIAQYKLLTYYEINTSNVDLTKIPETLRTEYDKRDESGKIKIGLNQSYRLLRALDDDLGKIFEEEQRNFNNIQNARNNSYLAHGFSSPKETTYTGLREFILKLNFINVDEIPILPKLVFKDL